MNTNGNWKTPFQREIEQAKTARAAGNEGMARVCARRAAGIVIGEYLQRRGVSTLRPNAYDRLQYLISLPDVSDEIRQVASHLVTRVTPDHTLPIDVDLISEAYWLKERLLEP